MTTHQQIIYKKVFRDGKEAGTKISCSTALDKKIYTVCDSYTCQGRANPLSKFKKKKVYNLVQN